MIMKRAPYLCSLLTQMHADLAVWQTASNDTDGRYSQKFGQARIAVFSLILSSECSLCLVVLGLCSRDTAALVSRTLLSERARVLALKCICPGLALRGLDASMDTAVHGQEAYGCCSAADSGLQAACMIE